MTRYEKLVDKLMKASSDRNFEFRDLCHCLENLGFHFRNRGSHRIFWRENIPEIINLQPRSDGNAKPYHVKQVREMILRYRLLDE